jgi:hypothetical protein
MLCERCHGAGKIAPIERIGNELMQGAWEQCPDCGGCGINSKNIQLDPSKIDWAQVEQETVRKLRFLRAAWKSSFEHSAELHKRMVLGIYMPALANLAAFCEAVEKEVNAEGDHG